ncbi:hypothetical protein Trydic_g21094 [Trypoxylus dichotomus]
MWDPSQSIEAVPALPRISQETFREIIQEKLDKRSLVVIFAEPNLSPEDFGAVDASGNEVFTQLPNIKASKGYLPSVNDPISVLKTIRSNDMTETTVKEFDVNNIKTSIVIIDLDDVQDDEDRSEILARHDKSITRIYKALQEKDPEVLAIYTGYHTSWIIPAEVSLVRQSRNVLQTPQPRADNDTANRRLFNASNFLMYVSTVPYLTLGGNRVNLSDHVATVINSTNETLFVNLANAAQAGVGFGFRFSAGYWFLRNVTLLDGGREIALRVRDVNALLGFSYQCTNTHFIQRNDSTISLVLPGMQLQVTRGEVLSRFGDPLYCIGFTSAPIWSGIFVTALLVTIMAIGLSMMMDIKTMDRFDDPKGKTIQINVSE